MLFDQIRGTVTTTTTSWRTLSTTIVCSEKKMNLGSAAIVEIPPRVLLWHMNYHPDGGQLFYPLENQPFVVPAALPGDDLDTYKQNRPIYAKKVQ